ncbi:MAG: hypothetical protein WAO28_03660 [Candidatus Microsaccharimonas sp.]
MSKKEVSTEPKFWRRNNPNSFKPRVGELEPDVSSLRTTMETAAELGILYRRDDDFLYSGEVSFDILKPVEGDSDKDTWVDAEAEARFKPGDTSIWLELYVNDPTDELSEFGMVRSYNIPESGVATNLTVDSIAVVEDSRESEQIEIALGKIKDYLNNKVWREASRRTERRRTIRNRVIGSVSGVLTVALAGGLTYGGLKTWVWDPNERDQELREIFDQQNYQLPGEGAPIDSHPFSTLPTSEFEAIPSFGGKDTNLENPRTVSLAKADGCVDINVEIKEGDQLYVTLPDSSLYVNYHYDTSLTENGFSVCFVEPIPEAGLDNDVEIAVQIK